MEALKGLGAQIVDVRLPGFAGVLALCVPCGLSSDGLPYSIQFTGRRLSEATLCRIAYAYEQATPWRTRHATVKTA